MNGQDPQRPRLHMARLSFLAAGVILAMGLMAAGEMVLAVVVDGLVAALLLWMWRGEIRRLYLRLRASTQEPTGAMGRALMTAGGATLATTRTVFRWTRTALLSNMVWWSAGPDG